MGRYVENNLNRDEVIVDEVELNPMELLKVWLIGIAFCWFFFIPTIYAISVSIRFFSQELAVTNKRVVGTVGAINTYSLDAPLRKVENVSVSSGLGGKLFNYGTVSVRTADGWFVFEGVKDADRFKRILMDQIEKYEDDKIDKQAWRTADAIKTNQSL